MSTLVCPGCGGEKTALAHFNTGADSSQHYWAKAPCPTCQGEGVVTQQHWDAIQHGKQLRAERRARQETLFDAARRMGISTPELSRLESGRIGTV